MARIEGTLKLSSTIEPRVAAPLDARSRVSTLADLTAVSTFPYAYQGMEVYVENEKKKYMLVGDDPTNSSNWVENGGSGGEGQTIQLEELPERWDESEIEENAIYQYIGETYRGTTYRGERIDYKNGYFYKATKVTNISYILWKELYGTKDWSELDRSVKRNYIPSIEFEATLPDSGFDVEIQKDGTFIVNSKTGTIRDNILFWEGTTIPAGEYILCTELLSGVLSSGCSIFISVKNETTSESELAEISSDISRPFKAGSPLIINEGDTIKFRIYATGNFTREGTFKFHALFQQFSIVDRSWQPADMLDNIELSNKIPDTSKMINIFTGTQAEWDALTTDEKLAYKQVNITDDESDPNVVVDAVTDGDMHAVTSNAVAEELEKVRIVHKTFSGNTDVNGNVYIRAFKNDYILIFASVNNTNYTGYVFYWASNASFYVHVTDAIGGAAPAGLAVTGDVYFVKWANIG